MTGRFIETSAPISRSSLARQRAEAARTALADCQLCAHHCGVNRLSGEKGLCHAGAVTRVFSAQTESADELELIPTFAIALSGCDLRCDFCVTGESSWNPGAGELLSVEKLSAQAKKALSTGARSIMILGGEPTIHLPGVLELVAALPDSARLVWKTNAHGSAQSRELLDGIFDTWVPDYKFGNDACAQRLARIGDYQRIVRENLLWAAERSDLIVRHLLMPGHIECCWRPVAEWLGSELPGVKVSLRSAFWPAWHSARHSELRGSARREETARARYIAGDCALNLVE